LVTTEVVEEATSPVVGRGGERLTGLQGPLSTRERRAEAKPLDLNSE